MTARPFNDRPAYTDEVPARPNPNPNNQDSITLTSTLTTTLTSHRIRRPWVREEEGVFCYGIALQALFNDRPAYTEEDEYRPALYEKAVNGLPRNIFPYSRAVRSFAALTLILTVTLIPTLTLTFTLQRGGPCLL